MKTLAIFKLQMDSNGTLIFKQDNKIISKKGSAYLLASDVEKYLQNPETIWNKETINLETLLEKADNHYHHTVKINNKLYLSTSRNKIVLKAEDGTTIRYSKLKWTELVGKGKAYIDDTFEQLPVLEQCKSCKGVVDVYKNALKYEHACSGFKCTHCDKLNFNCEDGPTKLSCTTGCLETHMNALVQNNEFTRAKRFSILLADWKAFDKEFEETYKLPAIDTDEESDDLE